MKFEHGKNKVSVEKWIGDQADHLQIVAFVLRIFEDRGITINQDVSVPQVQLADFHYNTADYAFARTDANSTDITGANYMYINQKLRGKLQANAVITAIIDYYSRTVHPDNEKFQEQLTNAITDKLYTNLSIAEAAAASSVIVGTGLLIGRILGKV